MAEAFLGVLLNNINSLIEKEIGLIVGADKEMKKLSSTLTTIQAVLEDAEDKQFESKPIRNWLRKLNDLAFEIDDLLDECGIEVSRLQKKNNKFRGLKKILYNHKIGRRMKEMVEKLDAVAAEREKFHFRETSYERQTEVIARRAIRETGSALNEPDKVYGREEEKEKIVDILVNHVKDSQQLSILPIIGLGGLGKTTLAQLVYNDQQVKDHFDFKMWVCVSDDFDPKILIKAMLESGGSASDSMPLDSLQHRLWEKLNNKRYLLILDDVWNEDQEEWAKLKNVLACGSRGALIVVTTRLKNVADIMGTLPAHWLSVLSEEHCWLLFKQCAFGEQEEEHPNLEAIGRQMMKKCGGVPLAAKTLGGLLRFKRKEKDWIHIKESELWNLEQKRNSILPSLRLSYCHLPLVLRRCFAYCALFRKDTEIEKEELIHLWMAHGCISSNGIQEVEDVGDQVWNELVLRSLFQEVSTRSYDRKIICKMHDLVHDLALSIMENQVPGAFANNCPTTAPNGKIRQILVIDMIDHFMTLRTSIQLQVSSSTSLVNFSRVRMLTAEEWPNTEAQLSSISKLKQLRCLELFSSSIQSLPNKICDLQYLQILNLNGCCELVRLPKNMRYMDSLRHLFLKGCDKLIEMPSRIGDLASLKSLGKFIVGDKMGNQLGELEHLNLGGRLEIEHLERVKKQMDARKANLSEKSNLRELVLKWEGDNASEPEEMMDVMVLEALEPHPSIETLGIFGFKGKAFPLWMENATTDNVVEIIIDNCPNCLRLPPLALLPRLKKLKLSKLVMIEFISEYEVEEGNPFPSLKKLDLEYLPNLKGLLNKELREMFPVLEKLFIEECPSRILSPLPSIKKFHGDIRSHSIPSSFSTLDNLSSLNLRLDRNILTCIPSDALERLSNLKELSIDNAHNHIMPVEHIRCLKSLTHLEIQMREAVTCVPGEWFQQLTTLKKLSISGCDLIEVPYEIKYLHSLESLSLVDIPKMVCLPEGLQHLPSLQRLILDGLNKLTSLPDWLDKLFPLKTLRIYKCPKIESLPSCIRRMTNLQTLVIYNHCPELRRRCEKVKGEDWHNIAHIPNLDIY